METILDLGCLSFNTSFRHFIPHDFVSAQYLENNLIEFNLILNVH